MILFFVSVRPYLVSCGVHMLLALFQQKNLLSTFHHACVLGHRLLRKPPGPMACQTDLLIRTVQQRCHHSLTADNVLPDSDCAEAMLVMSVLSLVLAQLCSLLARSKITASMGLPLAP